MGWPFWYVVIGLSTGLVEFVRCVAVYDISDRGRVYHSAATAALIWPVYWVAEAICFVCWGVVRFMGGGR